MAKEAPPGDASKKAPVRVGGDRYEIVRRIGQGGMGVVYEALDRQRGQRVALKTLRSFDSASLYLFKQEFRTLADVQHTNLVRFHELVASDANEVFFTMELVKGTDFLSYVEKAGAPGGTCQADVQRLRSAVRQLSEGLHALHAARKVHRDIKPSNVLVTPEGRVVLLDFGVAAELSRSRAEVAAGSGEMVGTAVYMAPEQAGENLQTPASDWYSVGVMLYEALVGEPPFTGTLMEVITRKSNTSPKAPSTQVSGVPEDLDELCHGLLRIDPSARPTGAEVLLALGGPRNSAVPPARLADSEARALVGRDAQLAALREAAEPTRLGRPVTVYVTGEAGMGKSTLVHRFLDGLEEGREALVLRGRTYERESVPFKAVDSIVDALSRYLVTRTEEGEPVVLPGDIGALARVFPVLRRVPEIEGIGYAGSFDERDARDARTRAFHALRELLVTISGRAPLAVFIDDAQWGDSDSARLLLEVVRVAGPLRLLLVMTSRGDVARSPFLAELRERWPAGAVTRDVSVGPLTEEESRQMALGLIDAPDEAAQRTARAVAREAQGSPFLVEELVRSNSGAVPASGARLRVATLEEMVTRRLESLSPDERRMLQVLAVAGRPLPVAMLADASGAGGATDAAIAKASALRFVRTGLREGKEFVEASHNRIREALVARLSADVLRETHGKVAQALSSADAIDAEAVAMHWIGAGDPERAVEAAACGTDAAVSQLAFDQGVRLLRFSLEHTDGPEDSLRRLRTRLAETLQLAGRHAESARAFLDAARGAPADDQLELRRAAAEQLLASGHIDEGSRVLRDVLQAVGMKAPRTAGSAIFWLLVYRFWLLLMGLRFLRRNADDVPRDRRLRVEALYTVAIGFGIVDPLLAACMQARHLIAALRAGDRFQVLRAVCLEASHIGSGGAPETERERRLLAIGRELVEAVATDEARAFYDGVRGITLFQRGEWPAARDLLIKWDGAVASRASVANVRMFTAHTLYYLGELADNARRITRMIADADATGEVYVAVSLRTSGAIRMMLNGDEPERARPMVDDALAQWSRKGFFVQQWQAMVYSPDIDLYEGDGDQAYRRFSRDLPALKKGLLMRSGFIRVVTAFVHGKCAVASVASSPERKAERLAEARGMVALLEREHVRWAHALAGLLLAMVEQEEGNRDAALKALRQGIALSLATKSIVFAVPAQYRLGELLGGDEGRETLQTAQAQIEAWGVRDPKRWVGIYMPGTWKA
jgi:tetratricopeptide (TPR) repeat protein